jgi:dTDP-4-dehydrorhamnose reductase
MKRPKVALFGADGQLGTEFRRILGPDFELHAFTRAQADFSKPGEVGEIVANLRPGLILNAAAYTAVDRAETEPELAFLVNAATPQILAQEAARCGALLIHYSTDYVFDGSKSTPWVEDDRTGPLNVYGASKLAGERAIASEGGNYLIFRTSWVFAPHGKNFLLTVLRLARESDRLTIVADQRGAPTSALAIARGTQQVLDALDRSEPEPGIYHLTCGGETSWYGLAQAMIDQAADALGGRRPEVVPISASDYPTPARRPANSVLDNGKLLRTFGVALPHWGEALSEAIHALHAADVPVTF